MGLIEVARPSNAKIWDYDARNGHFLPSSLDPSKRAVRDFPDRVLDGDVLHEFTSYGRSQEAEQSDSGDGYLSLRRPESSNAHFLDNSSLGLEDAFHKACPWR